MSLDQSETRDRFLHFLTIPTRWMDNDIYGHVNNVVYYSYFDTVINEYLIAEGGLDIVNGAVVGVAAESMCQFRRPLAFPDVIEAGLRIGHLGNSSVRYEIGLFVDDSDEAAAVGYFVHVFVTRASGKPTSMPRSIRTALERLQAPN
ncbi:MAG: acyl-CoA thioesterase [Acidiferrobacterales bacterium]